MKRAFDLVAAVAGLILLAPIMAVIAVLIRADTDGPAVFRQERIGRGGRPFTLYKFRSMEATSVPAGALITASTDQRITKIGARLRTTKLDELPQLINVLRGEMSLVGPRPEVAKYVDIWSEEDRRMILSVRPGITDPATLDLQREELLLAEQFDPEAFYRDVLVPQKTRRYREYLESRTFLRDFQVVLLTLKCLITDRHRLE